MSERDIFTAARELSDPTARGAYLDQACGGDAQLRTRVEALLRADGQPDSLLDQPAVAPHTPHAPDPSSACTIGHDGGASTEDEAPLGFLGPPTRPDALGRLGHYEVLQVLGKGGFGIVFRAFDDLLHRVVALKVLAPELAATSPARKRFLREARCSAQVRHENVVQVYEVAEQPLPYLAMEFIPGETLQQRLDRVGPVEPAEVVRIGRQIAEGLAAAHATDLVHRDIKPGNILLEGGAGRVKITDFGLARAADDASISQSGIIAGTPMYMAPEQAKGEKLDQRADLFSLGSVLYQMVCGRPPFRANSTLAVLKRVADDTPRDLREIIPETPPWLCAIIAKLHAKNPDERYQSAREVADVLADCEAQLKANAKLKDYSRIPRSKPQRSGRRKWVAAVVLLLPVLALTVTEYTGVTHLFRGHWNQSADSQAKGTHAITPAGTKSPIQHPSWALEFEGNGYVRVPTLARDKETPITLECWCRINPQPDKYCAILVLGGKELFGISHGPPPAGGYILAGCSSPPGSPGSSPVQSGRWVHLAAVADGREGRLYSNGILQLRLPLVKSVGADAQLPLSGLILGATLYGPDPGSFMTGQLREFRVSGSARYGAAFTPPEHFTKEQDTLALYHFDEGQGTALKDSSGNGHHGEIVGAKWVKADGSPISPPPAATTPSVAAAPFTNTDVQRIATLPAAEQIEEVRKELTRRNPGFDGKMETKIEGGVVKELRFVTDQVTDIAPIRVFNSLKVLNCAGTYTGKPNGLLADLSPLKDMNLATLTHLDLALTQVTDAGMIHFKSCKHLRHLDLNSTQVTDAGMVHFESCKDLRALGLAGTRVDAGLSHFKECKALTSLGSHYSDVSDVGLSRLADCKDLEMLGLSGTKVSDAGLAQMQGHKALWLLHLNQTQISDKGLAHLKACKSLRHLALGGTKVSDAGLAHLKGMPLTLLWIDQTAVTDLTALQDMPLEQICLTPRNITRGLDILREMKSLKTIGTGGNQTWPAAEFWERYDRGEFK